MSALAVSLTRDAHAAAPVDRRNYQPEAHRALRHEFIRALHEDPGRAVSAPGFGEKVFTASDVVLDDFSGKSGEQSLHQLLRIIGRAARGEDMHLQASAWVKETAERHASFHADDLAQHMEESA